MISKHDSLCDLVAFDLRSRGWNIIMHHEYHVGSIFGELDIFGTKYGKFMYVEVKTNPTKSAMKKATKQLYRAERCLFQNKKLYKMMAYWENDEPHYKWKIRKT